MALYERVMLTGMDGIEFLFSSQKQFEVWGRGVVVVSRLARFSSIKVSIGMEDHLSTMPSYSGWGKQV